MALRNRVTPFGEIVAVDGRGLLMGNRGVLHDADRTIVRDSQVRRWIACRLEFRGRHREIMSPGAWTELFFLDEATALAAGHRPCAECRHADYRRFQIAWAQAHLNRQHPSSTVRSSLSTSSDIARGSLGTSKDSVHTPSADAMDTVLHAERRARPWVKRTHVACFSGLPDGVYVALDERAWLVRGGGLLAWSPAGYFQRVARPRSGTATVLTPPSIVAVLEGGYQAEVHPSAAD